MFHGARCAGTLSRNETALACGEHAVQIYLTRLEVLIKLDRAEWMELPVHERIFLRSAGTVHEHMEHVNLNFDKADFERVKHLLPGTAPCPVVGVSPLS